MVGSRTDLQSATLQQTGGPRARGARGGVSSAQADPGDGDAGADEPGRGDGPRGTGPAPARRSTSSAATCRAGRGRRTEPPTTSALRRRDA